MPLSLSPTVLAHALDLREALQEIRASLYDSRPHTCAGRDCAFCYPARLIALADDALTATEEPTDEHAQNATTTRH